MEPICGLLLLLFPLWMIWKRPATMYWICLAFLWLQALAIVFNFNAVYAFVVEGDRKKGESILPLFSNAAGPGMRCCLVPGPGAAI